jgi:hypothetical protein
MPAITIRNVPGKVRDELARRAAGAGMSLQEYLLRELTFMTSYPDQNEWLDDVRAQAEEIGIDLTAEEILADRDADRR